MKKLSILLALAVAALTACSAHTIVAADVDLLSLIGGSNELSGDVTIPGSIQIYVPDADGNLATPDGGFLVDNLPVLEDLYGFGVDLVVAVKNTGTDQLTFSADFRLSSADDSANIYDGVEDVSLASSSVSLGPGESSTVELSANLEKGDPNLALISNQGFRVGIALTASGTTSVHYELTNFKVFIKQRPFDLLPPP
ncbi:hypothetical protein [Oceanithermus sp.]